MDGPYPPNTDTSLKCIFSTICGFMDGSVLSCHALEAICCHLHSSFTLQVLHAGVHVKSVVLDNTIIFGCNSKLYLIKYIH